MDARLENRYLVIKLKDLDSFAKVAILRCLSNYDIATRDAVVVESDWPIYKEVVEAVTGANRSLTSMLARLYKDKCDELAEFKDFYARASQEGNKELDGLRAAIGVAAEVFEGIEGAHSTDRDVCKATAAALRKVLAGGYSYEGAEHEN